MLHRLDDAALQAKIDAIRYYGSQISTFWQDEDDMARSVRADALMIGADHMAEREWRFINSDCLQS